MNKNRSIYPSNFTGSVYEDKLGTVGKVRKLKQIENGVNQSIIKKQRWTKFQE